MSLDLTLCDDPSGDPRVARPGEIAAIGQAVPSALLLLIHGYNNDVDEATEAYDAFERLQRQLSGQPDYAPGTTVARVFWPAGSQVWQFMAAIRRVPAVGVALAQSLQDIARLQQRPLFVSVVAHSLGCRLAMETIRAIRQQGPSLVVFDRLVFFAGALATVQLQSPPDSRQLRQSWEAVIKGGVRSLYSPADDVLSLAFPLGSTMAGHGEPKLPTALGHDYWALAARPADLGQAENRGAGHSDYWGWRTQTAASNGRFAGQEARRFLDLGGAQREMPSRYAPDRALEQREQERREQAQREAASRLAYGS